MLKKLPTPLLYTLILIALTTSIVLDGIFYTLSTMVSGSMVLSVLFTFLVIQKRKTDKKEGK